MTPELKDADTLAVEIGQRVIENADALRLYMDETFAAKFPILWAGRTFSVTVAMEEPSDAA